MHASGRNSGVLHAGIYYAENSLKATHCLDGSRAMAAYCDTNNLPISRIGKLIIGKTNNDIKQLTFLYERAIKNGANVSLITKNELHQREPLASTEANLALFSPETSVVDPKAILLQLYNDLLKCKVHFYFGHPASIINTEKKWITVGNIKISYGHLFNTAGMHADTLAKQCGLIDRYCMIPFKGMYYELAPHSQVKINHLIYPLPDMNVPFLGIHFTKSIHNTIYIGPTAFPVLGREHYAGIKGIQPMEALNTFLKLGKQYWNNKQGFRNYAHQEIPRFMQSQFILAAQTLVPLLKKSDIMKSLKVGIRAQLFNRQKEELVMDFLIEQTNNETHVLNAVSPAFTSAFSFSKLIVSSLNK